MYLYCLHVCLDDKQKLFLLQIITLSTESRRNKYTGVLFFPFKEKHNIEVNTLPLTPPPLGPMCCVTHV